MTAERSLTIVARVYQVSAWIALVSSCIGFLRGHASLSLDLLGFWIGAGLLRREGRWFWWADMLLRLDLLLLLPVFTVLSFTMDERRVPVSVLGAPVGELPRSVVIVGLAVDALLTLWLWRQLNRPEVAALFPLASRPPGAHSTNA